MRTVDGYVSRKQVLWLLCTARQVDSELISQVAKLPDVEVAEVVHGAWEHDADGSTHCTRCDFSVCYEAPLLGVTIPQDCSALRHCPQCGALMDGGVGNG